MSPRRAERGRAAGGHASPKRRTRTSDGAQPGPKVADHADANASFDAEVAKAVRAIPRGSVLSYGDVAKRAGAPRAARAVARALSRQSGLPWWRVIRSDGTLAEAVAEEQARLLRSEGVEIFGRRVHRTAQSL
ncbi:MAG TPA: methylated-DNA--[protein]-cysteine S-methyltransferase [Vulgatibacter sp.]